MLKGAGVALSVFGGRHRYRFVARFDVRAYYESIDHQGLLGELKNAGLSLPLLELVSDHLTLLDTRQSGRACLLGELPHRYWPPFI